MDTTQILNEVFQQVFDDDSIQITRATTADDIDAWDSLTHINLALGIEQRFKIRFALGEMQTLKNVGDLLELIEKKIKK